MALSCYDPVTNQHNFDPSNFFISKGIYWLKMHRSQYFPHSNPLDGFNRDAS